MTLPPVVHHAGPRDWERVRAVRLRALGDAPDAFWRTLAEESEVAPQQWRERLAADGSATFLAIDATGDVGMVVIHPSSTGGEDAGLAAMWVAPQGRGSGAGDALISAGIRWARAQGYRRIRLWINDTNATAARLYARHGFTATGVTGTFPPPREHLTEHELARDLH